MKPIITFIISSYNLPPAPLEECIDSILKLTLKHEEREIIVVDDGSDVSPVNELDKYINDIIFIRKRNGGSGDARNMGLRMATGNFVQFVDGNDCLIPASYELCLDVVRFKNPDMVTFDFTNNPDEESDILPTYGPVTGTQLMQKKNIRTCAMGYIFRRDTLMNLRFRTDILHEDEEFTPQLMLRCERVFCIDAKAYYYRERKSPIPNTEKSELKERRLNDMHTVIKDLYNMAAIMPSEDKQAMQRRVAQLTMDYIYNIIILTRNRQILNERLEELRAEGLFPLPNKKYTIKYQWFRKLTNSNIGLGILLHTLPFNLFHRIYQRTDIAKYR